MKCPGEEKTHPSVVWASRESPCLAFEVICRGLPRNVKGVAGGSCHALCRALADALTP